VRLGSVGGRGGFNGEGVDAAGYLAGQSLVNHTMHGQPALAAKGRGRNLHAKMTFAAGPVAGVTLVKMGLIHHLEIIRGKSLG
jgi:hypothetical protein